ncbi:MAG: hypothetical protein FJ253_07965 [Phycisphaerae bacterium]|nr:hypothetical protein [Phycisphaerae bacterium]
MPRSFASIAAVLAIVAVLAQATGILPHSTTVVVLDSQALGGVEMHWHPFGIGDSHHDCGPSTHSCDPQEPPSPDHRHHCEIGFLSAAPRPAGASSTAFVLSPAEVGVVSIVAVDEAEPVSDAGAARAHGRWCAGAPPSIGTTRLRE